MLPQIIHKQSEGSVGAFTKVTDWDERDPMRVEE